MLTDQDLVVLLTMSSIGLLVTTVGFAIAWVRARERALRLRAEPIRRADVSLANADRLEDAIGAMALEVERIGEHQRYMTKLLADSNKPE
ncbi:MAG TPA: hypothetical protein VL524_04305 [Gemmatimonadaceae bacterium]|jgi:hypothetical protein|nr:hypothetical protein [Gemmatimonadaceae bacterium]